jgi:hypothetical protein
MIATATYTLNFEEVDSSFTKVRGRKQPVEKPLHAPSEHSSGTQKHSRSAGLGSVVR